MGKPWTIGLKALAAVLCCVSLAGRAPAGAAPWHVDPVAGVRFPVPFPDGRPKTAAQVTALVLDHPAAVLPQGVRYTSGVYAQSGLPYILVWTRPDAERPTRSDLTDLAGASPRLVKERYGFDSWSFAPDAMRAIGDVALGRGLRSRVLMQLARDETIFVGLYYADEGDALLLDKVAAGLELAPEKRLAWDELPRGSGYWLRLGLTAWALAAGSAAALAFFSRRRRQSSAPP